MYAKHVIVGNLGNDPEMRYTPTGQAVCSFSIAVNRTWTDAQGQKHDETTWYKVATWGKLAEVCSQHLHKGEAALVESDRLKVSPYLNREGQAAASLEIPAATTVKFLGGRAAGQSVSATKPEEARPSGEPEVEFPF